MKFIQNIFLNFFLLTLFYAAPSFAQSNLMALYDAAAQETTQNIALDAPHLNIKIIENWVLEKSTEALTLDAKNYTAHKKNLSKFFEAYALSEHETYLNQFQFLQTLGSNNLRMNAIQNGEVKLISEGALNGSYRWLFDVPLLISFYPLDQTTMQANAQTPNQKITARVQIGRVKPDLEKTIKDQDLGIIIERWSLLAQ